MLVNLADLKELMSMIRFFRWRSSIRLSLQDILSLLDLNAEFDWKRRLWFEIGKAQAETTLRDCKNDCLLPFFRSCVQEGFAKDILKVLDEGKRSLPTRGSPRNLILGGTTCVGSRVGAVVFWNCLGERENKHEEIGPDPKEFLKLLANPH